MKLTRLIKIRDSIETRKSDFSIASQCFNFLIRRMEYYLPRGVLAKIKWTNTCNFAWPRASAP